MASDDWDSVIDDVFGSSEESQPAATPGAQAGMYAASVEPVRGESIELARELNLPVGTVERNFDELSKLAKRRRIDYGKLATDAPRTNQWLADPVNASAAQDDIDNLTGIEQAWDYLKKGGSALASGLPKFNEGIYGLGQAVTDTARTYVTGPLSKPINTGLFDLQVLPEDPLAPVSDFFSDLRQGQKGLAESMMPKGDGSVEQGVYSGLQSLGQNLLTLPAAIMSGNPGVALAPMVGGVGGSEYGRARDKGLDYSTAAIYATSQAAVEFATEKLPMGMLIKDLEKNTGFMSMLGKQLAAELPGEQIATLLQDLNEWAALNPEKPFSSYLAERPNAALQTAIATAIGTGGMVTVAKGIDAAASRFDARAAKAAKAIETRQAFERMNNLVNQTKFKTASPSTMKAFSDHVAEGGSVYIDARELANALQQSGISMNQVAVDIPSIAEQLQTKAAAGQHIKIPASEFLTKIAGTDYAPVMLDHLKTDPNDLSNAEADEILKGNSEAAKAEVERIIRVKRDVDAHEASAEVVRKGFEDQLNAADRFSKDVNKAKAQMLGSFYSVMAARIGITPEEMAARYPLQIRAENVGGQQVLNQDSDEIFYHDSDEPFSGIIEGKGRFGSAIFARQGRPSGYGKHTKAMRIKGEILELGGLREELGTDSGRDALKNILGRNTTDDAVDSVIEALTDGSHYPTDPDVWDAIGATDETDATVEIQTLRGNIARSLGYAAVRTPDEFDGETIMVLDNGAIADVNALNQAAQLPETIEIDGVQRPTANSNGKPIAQTEEGVRNFWRWFGDSKVVDEQGRPLVVYHGTGGDFDVFQLNDAGLAWAAKDAEYANSYAADVGNVLPVYFSVKSPFDFGFRDTHTLVDFAEIASRIKKGVTKAFESKTITREDGKTLFDEVRALENREDLTGLRRAFEWRNQVPELVSILARAGYDGIVAKEGRDAEFGAFAVFNPEQIKSAVGNSGAFDASNPNILYQSQAVGDFVNVDGVQRPTTNSNGKPIAQTEEGVRNFWRWFGDSKVVDEQGRPLVVYHGTTADFDTFRDNERGVQFVSPSKEWVTMFTLTDSGEMVDGANVMPVYVHAKSPFDFENKKHVNTVAASASLGKIAVDQIRAGSWSRIEDRTTLAAIKRRFDGVYVMEDGNKNLAVFSPEQIKSAVGNSGTFDPQNPNILSQGDQNNQTPRAEIAFGNDITQTPTVISLLKGADLSSFIHESGHFFHEVLADISSRPNAPLLLQEDFKTVMDWLGITREQWAGMTLEQKRPYHERFARGFEVFAWEGKAPNMALQKLFQRFRAWMLDAYKKLLDAFKNRDLGQALDVRLSDDVRAVFDRMLSTQEQINEAKAVRGYLPAFETKEEAEAAGVDWEQYQADIAQADEDAITDLESRSLRDLRWFRNAHNKEVRRLRREAAALRREARIDARAEVLRHPIYQVMQFLTARVDAIKAPKAKSDPNVVDPANDSLLVAVAKLGGLQRDMAVGQFGLDPADFKKTPVFGKPILRRNGGLTPDGMAEALAQLGYMPAKWGGSWDMNDLGDYLHDEGRGIPHYSENFDYRNLEEQNAGLPDLEANPFVGGRIDRESMVREYGGSTEEFPWENLSKMISNDGIHPDVIADRFGFQSGDEMVRFLLEAKPLLSAIEDTTDRIMFERHGDLTSKEALDKAADEAIHNRMRAKVLATEANALAKTLGARGITAKAARVFAERILAGMKILDIKPSHFAAEESKAAGRFDKARKKGNVNDQALEKRNQLVNNIATRLAYDVESEVVKAIRHFKQLQKPGSQKSMRGEYLEQLNALLERFELRTGGNSRKSINKANTLPAFAEWLQSKAEELGAPTPDMVAFVLDGGVKKPYRDMTLEEFRGLVDAVKQLEHLARREQKQYMAIRGMEFEQEKNAILDRLRQFHPDAFDADGNPKGQAPDFVPSLKQKLGKDANALLGEFLGNETIVNILEGGEMGLLHESLFKRISDRSNWRTTRMEGIFKKLEPLFDQYSIAEKRAFSTKDIGGPIGIPITREKALGVALLVGNAEGRDRVRNYGWTDEQIIKIIDLLDERDKRLAEAVWDLFDNDLWPDLKALNERTAGKAPPKVESTPYTNRLGTWKGGYMRLKYDSDLDERAYKFDVEQSLTDLRNGMGMSSKTPQGTSIERKQGVLMRPRLDFNVFVETVTETVHDIAYREAVSDVIRLLNDKEIQAAIKQAGGVEVFRAMRRRVAEVAARPRDPFGFIEKFVSIARRNTIVTLMSGVGTAFQNLTGLIPAAGRVHPWLLAREVQRFYSTDMKKSYDFAVSQSEYMRHRFTSYEQDLVNMANKLTVKGSLMPDTATFLALMGWIDRGVSVPVWNAAFAEGMEKHANDRVLAVEYADHVVRQTQGSGRIVDKPGIMSGHPLKTIFTMFHSYFNGQLQQLVRAGLVSAQEAKTNPRAAAGRVALAFVVFWILPALVTEMFRRTPDDEDDEEKAMRYAKGLLLYPAAMFPLVRDIAPWAWDKYVADSGWARSFRMSPVESAVEGVAKGVESTVDIVKGEGDQRDVKNLLMGVGFTFGVPGKLISDVVTGIYDFATGEAGPEAMLVGPQPKK